MGRAKQDFFDWQQEQERDERDNPDLFPEWDPLDFDENLVDEHPEWETDHDLTREELDRIERDAELEQLRHEGYWE